MGDTVILEPWSQIVISDLCQSEVTSDSHNAVHEAGEVVEEVGQKSGVA